MNDVTFTITATMPEDWADYFCSFLKRMETDGKRGHSETIGFYADGDGDFRPKFEIDHEYKHVNSRSSNYKKVETMFTDVLDVYDRS